MKDGSLVMQGFARFSNSLLASTKRPKVLRRLGSSVAKKTHDDATAIAGSFNFHVEKDLVGNLFSSTTKSDLQGNMSDSDNIT
jgi:hypothetical protein